MDTSRYYLGPGLLGKIRRTIRRVDLIPGVESGAGGGPVYQDLAQPARGRGGQLYRGTFTGTWSVAGDKVVTLAGSTQTFSVTNYCIPVTGDSDSTAQYSVVFGSAGGTMTAVEIEQPADECGQKLKNTIKLTMSGARGSGARAIAHTSGDCPTAISSVTVTNSGSRYAVLGRVEPTITITGTGFGATFTPTLTKNSSTCGEETWSIASVAVSGGTQFANGSSLSVSAAGAVVTTPAILTVNATNGVPDSVTVVNGGVYYKESVDATPCVDDVTVTLTQESPSAGSGAAFTANVDDNPESPTFGTILSVDVDDGGDGYFDRKYVYESTFSGFRFSEVSGYDGEAIQILGHEAGGCLKWFNVTDCSTATATIGVCCIGGTADDTITSEGSCTTAGGTWKAGATLGDLPGPCCA